jgi:hypothetical protein
MPERPDRDIEQRPVHPNIHQSIIVAIKGKNYVTLLISGGGQQLAGT